MRKWFHLLPMARSSHNKRVKAKPRAWGKASRPFVLPAYQKNTKKSLDSFPKKVGSMLFHFMQSLIHQRTKIITRMLILDMLSVIAEGVALFTFVFLLDRLYDLTDLLAGGTTLFDTILLLFCLIPSIMVLSFPMALLLSSMIVYGRMAHDNELVALQAGGYSSRQLLMPVIIVGIILTGILLWWSDRIAPKGLRMFQTIAAEVVQKTATTGIRPASFNRLGNFIFSPSEIENGKMKNIRIFEYKTNVDNKEKISGVITSPAGQLEYFPAQNTMRLHLENGALCQIPAADRIVAMSFEEMNFSMQIDGILDRLTRGGREEQRFSADRLKTESIKRRAEYEIYRDKKHLKYWKKVDVEKVSRIALPLACLFMVVIGSLLGMGVKLGRRSSCYSMTILVIFIYYILLNFGRTFAEDGTLPVWTGIWMPNFAGMLFIAWLYYRTLRV